VSLLRGVSLLLVVALLLGLATIGALQVLQSSRTATAGYELRELETQRSELSAQVRLLEAELARRASLEDVYVAATERLGMVRPESEMRVTVSVPAPEVVPMPERYIHPLPNPTAEVSEAWWEQALRQIPGLE
jgi:cell division protein FtsB